MDLMPRRLLVVPAALLALTVWMLAPSGALASEGCSNEALRAEQRSTFLADCRAYEMASPPDKNGVDVLLTTMRMRVAEDGDAVGFAALGGFAETLGVSVAADYVSVRSHAADPGNSGWSTHGISPVQRALSLGDVLAGHEPLYTGRYSPDLRKGVFFAASPLTDNPMVAGVPNLYRRTDLLTPGAGSYDLLTGCPLCDQTGTALNGSADTLSQILFRPVFAGASSDFNHVVFESAQALTEDAPAQPPDCNPAKAPFSFACGMRLYEWDNGTLHLAGILPDGSAADASFAGQGASKAVQVPGVVSDGLDGHVRVFFTQPTDETGRTLSQAAGDLSGEIAINRSLAGNLFMRVDHTVTEQLNLSERSTADPFAPASFLDASSDGTRAFFMTPQALTDDAPAGSGQKIYMYDASKPGADPHNLTLVNKDAEPADGTAGAESVIGVSHDGHYLYFISNGELVSGGPLFGSWIYLWHDGTITRVAPVQAGDSAREQAATGFVWVLDPQQSRVSADGRALLFSSISGEGLTGYDHGNCGSYLGTGCRELYVYRADTHSLECASCNPSGAAAQGMATDFLGENTVGGTRSDPPNTLPLSADGSRVFFSSPDALVPQDVNGRYDAYEYNVTSKTVSLLSSGKNPSDSYFINASPSGNDAFVLTRDRLVGWDRDEGYDLYDVRVDGGFPEPTQEPPCTADSCRTAPESQLALLSPASLSFTGAGNLTLRRNERGKSVERAKRLKRALSACRRKAGRHRVRCEARARRRFGKRNGTSGRAGR
jgi:hypothetical protein